MAPRITLLLGKPPKPGALLADVAEDLRARGCTVTVRLPHEERVEPADLTGESLVVYRGLHDDATPLLTAAHETGVPLCNPWPGERLLRDRRAWQTVLAAADVPLPPSAEVQGWTEVRTHAGEEPVVVKAVAGPGRGARVLTGTGSTLPHDAPFAGPYLVETRLPTDGTDRKLYLAGSEVRGLLKTSTLEGPHTTSGTPFDPGTALRDLAARVQQALDMHVLGVDVLHTPSGPVVVDVNAFPGFRGVSGAAGLVTQHLLEHAAH